MPVLSASAGDGACTVAVLDDDRTLSMVICHVFRACGLRADHFADIGSFDAAIGRHRYDAFVLDWQLADATTRDVIRRLRQTGHSVSPIFLYSGELAVNGEPVEPEIAATLAQHQVRFRQKPYSLQALAVEIREALGCGGAVRRARVGAR